MRHLRRFVHFVSKKAMDIEGLSEATLERFIGRGWLHTFMDLYRLDEHQDDIVQWMASAKDHGNGCGTRHRAQP